MKKRLLGFVFIVAMVAGFSMAVYAELPGKQYPAPHGPLSIELGNFE